MCQFLGVCVCFFFFNCPSFCGHARLTTAATFLHVVVVVVAEMTAQTALPRPVAHARSTAQTPTAAAHQSGAASTPARAAGVPPVGVAAPASAARRVARGRADPPHIPSSRP